MIYINPDPHLSLNEGFKRLKIKDEKVLFVKSRIVNYDSNLHLIKLSLVFIRSVIQLYDIFFLIIKFRKTIIVREFSNNAMLLFSPILSRVLNFGTFIISFLDFNINLLGKTDLTLIN